MSHIRIDKQKAVKKWAPVLENMGVTGERVDWMAEYAEFHSINENAYVNASNVSGMGAVVAAQPSALAGNTIASFANQVGSGDVGQNLLPVAMKIAAQTIGLDLVAVKPSPGPKIDLLYVDFRYDDTHLGAQDERPQVFKLNLPAANLSTVQTALRAFMTAQSITESTGGLQNGRIWANLNTLSAVSGFTTTDQAGASKQGTVEFLGFSRIDGYPMFRAYRQFNTAHTNVNTGASSLWSFDQTRNTFDSTNSMKAQISQVGTYSIMTGSASMSIELVSALEDHIPGFAANWNSSSTGFSGNYPMDREMDDQRYAGVIGPKISSKTIAVGTIEVTSALRRTEIEDIKANTGMDIVQKMESILVNELSQTISKQIVAKIFEMGNLNRNNAPASAAGLTNITNQTIFDLDTAYASSTNVGGETTHAVQRKLITKIAHASNYIATEGRVGPAQYLITNGGLAAALQDIAGYTINPLRSKLNGQGQLYPVGTIGDIAIYVDPYMRYNDNRIVLGRKNNADQPGIIFVPYLMAQSISVISEATFAPRMLLRSRYAVAEVGWYPQKQFMTIVVEDANQLLN